jgi:hypothetical protein
MRMYFGELYSENVNCIEMTENMVKRKTLVLI